MIANQIHDAHPYEQFEGTRQWSILDRALDKLTENNDLEEKTGREYIVGFLCKALATDQSSGVHGTGEMDLAYVRSAIAKAQAMMRQADPNGASMASELIAERRRDAACE